jgi:hypothetical protein
MVRRPLERLLEILRKNRAITEVFTGTVISKYRLSCHIYVIMSAIATQLKKLNETVSTQNSIIVSYQRKQADATRTKAILSSTAEQLEKIIVQFDRQRDDLEVIDMPRITAGEIAAGNAHNILSHITSTITALMRNSSALRLEIKAIRDAAGSNEALEEFAALLQQAEEDGVTSASSFRTDPNPSFVSTRPQTPPSTSSPMAFKPVTLPPTPPSTTDAKPATPSNRPSPPTKAPEAKSSSRKTDTVANTFQKAQTILSGSK